MGALTALASAPKSLAKAAAPASLEALNILGVSGGVEELALHIDDRPQNDKGRARAALAKLLGKSAARRDAEMRQWHIYSLDPDTAGLRSVTIGAKIRRSRRIQYEQSQRREEFTLNSVIKGLFD